MQHFRLNKRLGLSAAVTASLFLAGCVSIGPRGLELSRTEFNSAIQRTDGEQLLLNIVRQRYNDPVMFLEVASVSSSISRTASLNLSGFFPGGGSPESYNGGVGGSYSDSPLVFYSPNTGERFVRQILTPIDLRTISLLLQSGWSIDRLMECCVDRINGVPNSPVHDIEDDSWPEVSAFRRVAALLKKIQDSGQLRFATEFDNPLKALSVASSS